MKDLLTCVLALTWVLVVIRQMGTHRRPREPVDNIDREFRDLVDRARRNPATLSGPWQAPCILHNLYNHCPEKPRDGCDCRVESTTLGYSDDDGKTWFTKPGGVDGPSTD